MKNWEDHIPSNVQNKLDALGDEGLQWKKDLNTVIDCIAKEWSLSLEQILEGGSEAFVAKCALSNQEKGILKLFMPQLEGNPEFEQQVEALRVVNGAGYVKLLKYDAKRKAVLLECLGEPLSESDYSIRDQMKIICGLLKKTWIPLDEKQELRLMGQLIGWFQDFILSTWEKLEQPCSKEIIERALLFLESRRKSLSSYQSVLVHGDPHADNILKTLDSNELSYKLIDPDGILGEPAYDLGILVREWVEELVDAPLEKALERVLLLHNETGVEKQSIWEWAFIQSVSTGLFLKVIQEHGLGDSLLRIAQEWLRFEQFPVPV